MKDGTGESFYSQFEGQELSAQTTVKSAPVETPHANRPHGQLKYENNKQFQQKAESAPTEAAPKTNAATEFWRMWTRQQTDNHIAMKINKLFVRNNIHGENFDSEKARYLAEYEKLLMNGYK